MKSALLLVDIQNDFLPGGALAVKDSEKILSTVQSLMSKFEWVFATRDFHPADHESFASMHSGRAVGEVIDLHGLDQLLWPDHCVQGSHGSEFSEQIDTHKINRVFVKGTDPKVDSYSGFFDNGRKNSTGMDEYLKNEGFQRLYVVGLATDFCVKFTVLDALSLGFEVVVIEDGCKGVNLQAEDHEKALREMEDAGATVLKSSDL